MTDLPMLQACLEVNPNGVYTVWVTQSDELRQTVSFFEGENLPFLRGELLRVAFFL